MASILNTIFYVFLLLSVYVQVFFFVTFLENRKKIVVRDGKMKLKKYEAVTIVVPCWNEEQTLAKTIHSLLDLNYPKEKLQIFIVDDGSTDGTWEIMKKFEKPARLNSRSGGYPEIKIFRKRNEGKFTALNLGLAQSKTDFFGCLDADSLVHPESLVRIMSYFEKDQNSMAVAPCVTVHNPENILQSVQKVDYHMGVYFKKMLGFLGAISVTPGPLAIFRKKVFDDLGPYRHGHNSEDMEIACRMQKNHYKIEYCNDAYVYTNVPKTIKNLYSQRLRWTYGLINNIIDYKEVLFKKKYGNFSMFTLPMGVISIFSVSYLFGRIIYSTSTFLYSKILVFKDVGFNSASTNFHFDLFFLNTQSFLFLVVLIYILVIFAMIFGRKMAEGKWKISLGILYFFPIFSIIAPFWFLRAVFNTILSRRPDWR